MSGSDPVPVIPIPEDNKRVQEAKEAFAARFNHEPNFLLRVPGRYNNTHSEGL